jgi:hypothetical protein
MRAHVASLGIGDEELRRLIIEALRREPEAGPGIGRNGGPPLPPDYADTATTARRAGSSKSHFEKLRVTGRGPPYRKLGKKVIYFWPEVKARLDARIRHSTTEAA